MPYANVALQSFHVPLPEHVPHKSIALALLEPGFLAPGHDARGVLATMLQYSQRVVQALGNRLCTYYSYNATHKSASLRSQSGYRPATSPQLRPA